MPRNHIRNPGSKKYADFTKNMILAAKQDVTNGMSLRQAAKKHNISKDTINREVRGMRQHKFGRPCALSEEEEILIASKLQIVGSWGYPLDITDLKLFVKQYLINADKRVFCFKNNIPGTDWCHSFAKRQKLSLRTAQNMKPSRAAVSHDVINKYFDELEETLQDVPSDNLINFDETNLTDDPGSKQVLIRRGTKRISRIINHSKSSVSLMIAATASGTLLPVYTVYKSVHLYDTWCQGRPPDSCYGRTKSGWFESDTFENWFLTVALPYLKDKPGKKCLIGDNLSSHLSLNVVKECEKHNIYFTFLPPNATNFLQPLDVSFFAPMKKIWRKQLEEWKMKHKVKCLPKQFFPSELAKLMHKIQETSRETIKSGFRKAGIFPIDRTEALNQLPPLANEEHHNLVDYSLNATANATVNATLNSSLISFLEEHRFGTESPEVVVRKKKITVPAGKSIVCSDINIKENTMQSDTPKSSQQACQGRKRTCLPNPDAVVIKKIKKITVPTEKSAICSDTDVMDCTVLSDDQIVWQGVTLFGDKPVTFPEGSYILVKYFMDNGGYKIYLGKAESLQSNSTCTHGKCTVKYLRNYRSTLDQFVWPNWDDIDNVFMNQIIGVMSTAPDVDRRGVFHFQTDCSQWK